MLCTSPRTLRQQTLTGSETMPRLKGYRFRSLGGNGEEQTPDVIVPPERVDTNWRLADGHRLVLDDIQEVRGGLPTTRSSVLALTGGCTPIRPSRIAAARRRSNWVAPVWSSCHHP